MTLDARERSRYSGNPVECYRFQADLSIWRFTSADERVPINVLPDGLQMYEPEPIRRGEIRFSQEESSGGFEVTVPRWNPVAALFIASPPSTAITLTVYRTHLDDGQVIPAWIGTVISAVFDGSEARLECRPVLGALKRTIPRIVAQRTCNWPLYSPGCGINKAAFMDLATVSGIAGAVVTAAIFSSHADGWYDTGWLERADKTRRYVLTHLGNSVTLQTPFVGLAVGEIIQAFAGCLRTEAVCTAKFNNIVNFLGFERLPSRNPYEQGLT